MFCGGGFELSWVFRACFVGALLDRGLGPPASTVAVLVFRACFAGSSWVTRGYLFLLLRVTGELPIKLVQMVRRIALRVVYM